LTSFAFSLTLLPPERGYTLNEVIAAKWTNQIHDEWTRNLQKNRPDLHPSQIARTRTLMDAHVTDALAKGFESLIPTLTLPDPDDRHVLAAAIHAKATVIVTFNLRDFPVSTLEYYGIEAQNPDDFACNLLISDGARVIETVQEQRSDLNHPPKTPRGFLGDFGKHGLVKFAKALKPFVDDL
jgi:PIN domain